MGYHNKYGHTLEQKQEISLMSRIDICYKACHLETQTVAPNIPAFQGIKRCIRYLVSHPHKYIFYLYYYYYVSNVIGLTYSRNQV